MPQPLLASYSYLPRFLVFQPLCPSVPTPPPHLLVSLQTFPVSSVLVSCILGLSAHCLGILTFLPSCPTTLSPVSTQLTHSSSTFLPRPQSSHVLLRVVCPLSPSPFPLSDLQLLSFLASLYVFCLSQFYHHCPLSLCHRLSTTELGGIFFPPCATLSSSFHSWASVSHLYSVASRPDSCPGPCLHLHPAHHQPDLIVPSC